MKVKFGGRILLLGFGAVGRCTLPLVVKHVEFSMEKLTIMDQLNVPKEPLETYVSKGAKFLNCQLTQENLEKEIIKHVGSGDLLIDLAWEIETTELLDICRRHKILYINAATEEWHPYLKTQTYEKTLYVRQMRVQKWLKEHNVPADSTTAVLDHGANPGLISHFVKQGLVDIGKKYVQDGKMTVDELESFLKNRNFAGLAMKLNIKVIHCSEKDTQLASNPKKLDEFVNTWSVEGFYEEGIAPAELGWGTHEKTLPSCAIIPPEGPKNEIFLENAGVDTWVRSFVPGHEIIGMVIRHGEAFSISDRFTVWENDKPVYRPTVHYAYNPCDSAISSLMELRANNMKLQSKHRILRDPEILPEGRDILGALMMGHDYNSWWIGSSLCIEEAQKLIPGHNATTVQVAAGMIGAIVWIIQNPNKGVCSPDDIPHEPVLELAMPYLGDWISQAYDWTPLKNKPKSFANNDNAEKDPWQFQSFLYRPL